MPLSRTVIRVFFELLGEDFWHYTIMNTVGKLPGCLNIQKTK